MGAAWHPFGLAAGFRPALVMDCCHEPCGLGEPCGAVCWALKSWRRIGGLELVCSVLPESLGQLVQLGRVLGLVVGQQPPQLVLPPRVFGLPGAGSRSLGACWSGARAGGWAQGRGWSLPSQVVWWRSHGFLWPSQVVWWRSHGFLWPVALACKCSLLGEDWPRWLWWLPVGRFGRVSPLLLWAAVVVSWLALSSPCHLLVGAVVASWDQGLPVVASQGLPLSHLGATVSRGSSVECPGVWLGWRVVALWGGDWVGT